MVFVVLPFQVQYRPEASAVGTWSEAEMSAESLQEGGHDYVGKFTVPELLPRTVYLARVASLNQYGYNDFGEVFKFATKGAGN